MSLFFQWIEQSWLGTAVNNSLWAFAAFEAVHLLALAVIGGAVLVVDLRTLGWVFPRQRVAEIAGEARPWLIGSVIAMFLTGIPLMASLAFSKYYFNEAFRLKMYFLGAALLFTFFVRQRIAMSDDARANSRMAKAVAVVSVLLWSGVGIMGRGIGSIEIGGSDSAGLKTRRYMVPVEAGLQARLSFDNRAACVSR